MATAQEGRNPGRTPQPMRQSPAKGIKQDMQETPSELFGLPIPQTSGLGGTQGASGAADVTNMPGQLDEHLVGGSVNHSETTLDGSAGSMNPSGGDSTTYTDPFGYLGGVNRDVTVQGDISGDNDWTQCTGKYATGPTLPGIEGNRPTETGVGQGRIRGAGKGL